MAKHRLFTFDVPVTEPQVVEGLRPFFICPAWSRRSLPDLDNIGPRMEIDRCYRVVGRWRELRLPCPPKIRDLLLDLGFLSRLFREAGEYWERIRFKGHQLGEASRRIQAIVDEVLDGLERDGIVIPIGHQAIYFPPAIWCPVRGRDKCEPTDIYRIDDAFPIFPVSLIGGSSALVVPLRVRDLAVAAGISGVEFYPLVRVVVNEILTLKWEDPEEDWPQLMPFLRHGVEKYERGHWDPQFCLMRVRYFKRGYTVYHPFPDCGACGSNLKLRHYATPDIIEPYGMGVSDVCKSGRTAESLIFSHRMCRVFQAAGITIGFKEVEADLRF